jgi:hypothetical protein
MHRRLGGPQRWFGHSGKKKNLLPMLGIEPYCPAQDNTFNGDNFSLISEIMWLLFYTDGMEFKCTMVRWLLI